MVNNTFFCGVTNSEHTFNIDFTRTLRTMQTLQSSWTAQSRGASALHHLFSKVKTFSAHKSHCTLKGLLGVAPHGAVTFISPLYAGSISDEQIMREFGILSLLRPPGMAIMVDRGFLVDDIVPCKIYRPVCEVRDTQAIARLKAFPHSAMRKSEANHPRMLLSHRARNECSPSANSHLHARWRRPTMHFCFM